MGDQGTSYDCITFHTSACDDHCDRMINVHSPDGVDDVCPLCRIEELEAEVQRLREQVYQRDCDLEGTNARIGELKSLLDHTRWSNEQDSKEIRRLREAIVSAPHEIRCPWPVLCNCWKSKALEETK